MAKSNMTFSEKLHSDFYKNKLPYASRKQDPVVHANYRAEEQRLFDQFRRDALEDVGLTSHPKADKVWALAWEHGRSGGYNEVYIYLSDFADLVL